MTFLDTVILVGAVLEQHPEHAACLEALEDSEAPFTDAHALAEAFATLSGFNRVPVAAAIELTLGLRSPLCSGNPIWMPAARGSLLSIGSKRRSWRVMGLRSPLSTSAPGRLSSVSGWMT